MIFGATHILHTRIEFDDVDAGGVLHHPKYLNYLERARGAAMRDSGYAFSQSLKDGVCFVVSEVRAKYLRPARYEQAVTILSRPVAIRRSSIKVLQAMVPGHISSDVVTKLGDNLLAVEQPLFLAQLRLVCVDLATLTPRELSPELSRSFQVPSAEELSRLKRKTNTQLTESWTFDD